MTLAHEVPGEVISAAVQVNRHFLPAEVSGRNVRIRGYSADAAANVLRPDGSSAPDNYGYRGYRYNSDPEAALRELRGFGSLLAQRARGEPVNNQSGDIFRGIGRNLAQDTLRVYIYATAPKAFRLSGDEFTTGKNFVLYVQDFAISAASSAP